MRQARLTELHHSPHRFRTESLLPGGVRAGCIGECTMGITKVFRHAKFELSDAIARARTRYCRHWAELAGHARVLDLALLEDRVLLSASPAGGLVQAIQPAEGLGPEAVLTGGTQGDASAISVSESANCNEQPGSNSAIQAGTVDHTSMRRSPSPTDDAQEDPDNPRIVDDHLVQFDVHIVDSSNTPLLAPRHELVILDSNIQQVSELRDYVSQQHKDGR